MLRLSPKSIPCRSLRSSRFLIGQSWDSCRSGTAVQEDREVRYSVTKGKVYVALNLQPSKMKNKNEEN